MLGNSWVPAQLEACLEEFNCMELSVHLIQVVLEHSSKVLNVYRNRNGNINSNKTRELKK
jgi:hypothetical protein